MREQREYMEMNFCNAHIRDELIFFIWTAIHEYFNYVTLSSYKYKLISITEQWLTRIPLGNVLIICDIILQLRQNSYWVLIFFPHMSLSRRFQLLFFIFRYQTNRSLFEKNFTIYRNLRCWRNRISLKRRWREAYSWVFYYPFSSLNFFQ